MKEAFYEESAQSQNKDTEKRRYTVFQIFQYISIAIAIILLIVCFNVIPGLIYHYREGEITGAVLAFGVVFWVVFVVVALLFAFLFFRLKRRFNVSFDYIFVEDELRIAKVFNGKKRRPVVTFKAGQILKIGNWADEEGFSSTLAGLNGAKPRYMTPNREPSEGKYFIYLLASTEVGKNVYIIECRMNMLEYLVRAVGRSKLEWRQ